MILKCPDCGSKNIGQYRMLTGAIWCYDCYYTAPHKEKYNPFIVNEENDQIVSDFYKKKEK